MRWARLEAIARRWQLPADCVLELMELIPPEPESAPKGAFEGDDWHDSFLAEPSYARDDPPRGGSPIGALPRLEERYARQSQIGAGAMGEVFAVFDEVLHREAALKRAPRVDALRLERFVAEARLTARLSHPGIVPVHDLGVDADGRPCYVMKRIEGVRLSDRIRTLRRDAEGVPDAVELRHLVNALLRAGQAVAYAHSRGVLHLDLKPDNIMIGAFGEVVILDWGIARAIDEPPRLLGAGAPVRPAPGATRDGQVQGTPAYMPPEQARGDLRGQGPWTDVFALGAILATILSGSPPYAGRGPLEILDAVIAGEPWQLSWERRAPTAMEALIALCRRAMAHRPQDRYADAGAMVDALERWLDGAQRRDQALERLADIDPIAHRRLAVQAEIREILARATALRASLQSYDPVPTWHPLWDTEDEAAELSRSADQLEVDELQTIRSALNIMPELPEAEAVLADWHRRQHEAAERAGDEGRAGTHLELLRRYDRADRHAAYLRGDARLTLHTRPEGARVTLFRAVERRRRLVLVRDRVLGRTPITEVVLPAGSYVALIERDGHAPVRYPLCVGRLEHWDGIAPGGAAPTPIALPTLGSLGPDDRYVPSGWTQVGGDARASTPYSGQRVWVDGFVIRRFPVTVAEYFAFLNDLLQTGREAEALRYAPCSLARNVGRSGPCYRFEGGRMLPDADFSNRIWEADWPVTQVDWFGACAYADWASVGEPRWRLPHEIEREKAARGVDGRPFPWGSLDEPVFALMAGSKAANPERESVRSRPRDSSPYGVRGLAGLVRDWCQNENRGVVGRLPYERLGAEELVQPADLTSNRSVRGGSHYAMPFLCRAAGRFASAPDDRAHTVGFRLARSWP